jgi:hypothetical protein
MEENLQEQGTIMEEEKEDIQAPIEVKVRKTKKKRTQKQIEAFERARQKRLENIKKRKEDLKQPPPPPPQTQSTREELYDDAVGEELEEDEQPINISVRRRPKPIKSRRKPRKKEIVLDDTDSETDDEELISTILNTYRQKRTRKKKAPKMKTPDYSDGEAEGVEQYEQQEYYQPHYQGQDYRHLFS